MDRNGLIGQLLVDRDQTSIAAQLLVGRDQTSIAAQLLVGRDQTSIAAQLPVGRDQTSIAAQLLTFGAIGIVGFIADASVLHLGMALGLGLYLGRVVSYTAAVTVTWALNRVFTFRGLGGGVLWRQWAAFATSQLGGASVNFGTYVTLVATTDFVARWPVIGVAAGSILGMLVNFTLAKHYVFQEPHLVAQGGSADPAPVAERHDASRRKAAGTATILLAALGLCWTAFLNGQPFFFTDTTAYVRGADYAVQKVSGRPTVWSQQGQAEGGHVPSGSEPATNSLSSPADKAVLAGRSVYYGVLLYAGHIAGGFWLTVAVQAGLIAAGVFLTLRAIFPEALLRAFTAITALAVLTPVSFFASYLMPDVFAGLAILACANLIALPHRIGRFELAFWFGLLTFAFAVHSSHLLTGVVLAAIGFALAALSNRKRRWRGLAVICAAIMTAWVAEGAFYVAVTKIVGEPPIRPPFLMARVIEDGPGYRYLKKTCPGNGYAVCAFVDRLPLPSDDFLWNADPARGVFAISDAETRRALSAEQISFVASTISYDPFGQAAASSINWLRQLGLFGLVEFNYGEGIRTFFSAKLPAKYYSVMSETRAFRKTMPIVIMTWLTYLTVLASIAYLILMQFIRPQWNAESFRDVRLFSVPIVCGIIFNAAICGVLSSPHDRYQARVIWLLPFLALIFDFCWRSGWWARVFARAKFFVPQEASPSATCRPDQ